MRKIFMHVQYFIILFPLKMKPLYRSAPLRSRTKLAETEKLPEQAAFVSKPSIRPVISQDFS